MNTQSFLNHVDSVLDRISNENKLCVLMGDFNLNLLNFESHSDTNEFLNILGSFLFSPHIIQPTRITYHSATLIDNIFFNSTTHHTISGNIINDLSDHLPNFLIINNYASLPKNLKIYKRDYSQLNTDDLLNDFEIVDWDLEFAGCVRDASGMFDVFYNRTCKIIDDHVPLKQLSKKAIKLRSKPWISKAIQKSISVKNKLYKKFVKHRTVYWEKKYKQYKNLLNNVIKLSKKKYFHKFFEKNSSDVKNIWKGIRSLISLKPFDGTVPSKLVYY